MTIDVSLVLPEETQALRELYREEMDCQIILDSWHGRGWTDSYLLRLDGRVVGYGLVGGVRAESKETVTEFYVQPAHRGLALPLFRRFAEASRARAIETQSNDVLLTLMLYDCASKIESHVILFRDALTTSLSVPGAAFRETTETDKERLASQGLDTEARWIIEADGSIVAVGGLLFHYNVPYGDMFMEVTEPHRRRGYGSYLIQELKRVAYEMGKIPAARCNAANAASRATLQKAGMLPCARMLHGVLRIHEEESMAGGVFFKVAGPIGDTDLTAIPVKSIGPAVGYYTQCLGFTLVQKEAETARLRRDDVEIGLAVNGQDPDQASCWFSVGDVDDLWREFDAKGIGPGIIDEQEFDGKPYRVFFAKDPYGVCFCFTQPVSEEGANPGRGDPGIPPA